MNATFVISVFAIGFVGAIALYAAVRAESSQRERMARVDAERRARRDVDERDE